MFSLKHIVIFVGFLALCFAANVTPTIDEWDKGEHYRCVDQGFPFSCYTRCVVTWPARQTASGNPETDVNNETISIGLSAANLFLCLLFSVLATSIVAFCTQAINARQVITCVVAIVVLAAINCRHHYEVDHRTPTSLMFTAGFPFSYCEHRVRTYPAVATDLIAEGWPYNQRYFRIIQKPRMLFWDALICGGIALTCSMLFRQRTTRADNHSMHTEPPRTGN